MTAGRAPVPAVGPLRAGSGRAAWEPMSANGLRDAWAAGAASVTGGGARAGEARPGPNAWKSKKPAEGGLFAERLGGA
ncbi:hypothetical protein PMO31116_04201 [Pandoraea morbifera]|uniref:Uncharacterized protein n=1 Tax=Pandoraea morbifera TaxID=2508300 RepID=A0A5E4Y244_9BURK|nr:hypothetical protein PMO31116_04201 [Pandoraea morbifera]